MKRLLTFARGWRYRWGNIQQFMEERGVNPFVEMIGHLRGGVPDRCDWCDKEIPKADMIPVSGGEWVCPPCLNIHDAGFKNQK